MKVTVYYGPLEWYEKKLGDRGGERLPDRINELDAAKRVIRHRVEGQDQEPVPEVEPQPIIERLVAVSSDYSSIQEHAITNFVGLVQELAPKHLLLHNPPAAIVAQLKRVVAVKEKRYEYPTVTRDTLVGFRDGFEGHLVGQKPVRDRMLAALYPLTKSARSKPIVVMFYGPSGVGKTETAQFINSLLGGQLMRKQFSMFQNENFASYLFGGSHHGSSFARDLLDRSSGVILLDEFDKANPIFHSAFYEMFDDGTFVDKNYRVDVGNCLVICTSNYKSENEIESNLGEALYSRFDALIEFTSLTPDQVREVLDRLIVARYAELTTAEKSTLDVMELRTMLQRTDLGFANVRKLGKLVDEVISLRLVGSMLQVEATQESENDGASANTP